VRNKLWIDRVNVFYGDIQVLWGTSLNISLKEMVTMVGSNGAGKTTTINAIGGVLHPTSGTIHFLGQPIHQLPPHKIIERGMSLIPEGRKLFPDMTVLENLELGAYFPNARRKIPETLRYVFGLFPRLEERKGQLAGTLSGGEQQMLTVGRGLMSIPQLLLIDEPSMGLAPILVVELFRTIRKINQEGATVFLVEQNARLAMEISDRTYVLENGRIVREGKSKELLKDDEIRKAYLGL
jgi:branched-chain amino acid transport system ATP-binding protein